MGLLGLAGQAAAFRGGGQDRLISAKPAGRVLQFNTPGGCGFRSILFQGTAGSQLICFPTASCKPGFGFAWLAQMV